MTAQGIPHERLHRLEAMHTNPLQFTIPRRADAIDFPALRREARDAGLVRWTIEYNERHAGPPSTRITCAPAVALLLMERLRVLAAEAEKRHDSLPLVAAAEGMKATFDALDRIAAG